MRVLLFHSLQVGYYLFFVYCENAIMYLYMHGVTCSLQQKAAETLCIVFVRTTAHVPVLLVGMMRVVCLP